MSKKRVGYFDVAKFIAVLFIIIGHTGLIYPSNFPGGMSEKIVHLAFTFHVPLFFIVSGFFFKPKQLLNKQFFKKGLKSLLLPYVASCVLIVIGSIVVAALNGTGMAHSAINWTVASLAGQGAVDQTSLLQTERIGGIWFLLALFWAQIIIIASYKLPKPELWILGAFLLGTISARYVIFPWSIQSGAFASLFIFIGIKMRDRSLLDQSKKDAMATAIFSFIVWAVYFIGPYGNISFPTAFLPNGMYDLVGTLCASYCVLMGCRHIEQKAVLSRTRSFLQWIGRNTLVVFCVHIIEDDVLTPYWIPLIHFLGTLFPVGGWLIFLAIRLCVIALICGMLYITPVLSTIFFPSKRAAKQSKLM